MSTVAEITALLRAASADEFAVLERSLAADTRKGVRDALAIARRRIDAERAERERIEALYQFQDRIVESYGKTIAVGLDEVGRGALAGPLAVGGVVLPSHPRLYGLNDSKQLTPKERTKIAEEIKGSALAWTVEYVSPQDIDSEGITTALMRAFKQAIVHIDESCVLVDIVLLDGNPLHVDEREVSVVKGDATCAAIAAASIVAKVERDNLMCDLATNYPEYHWDECKGYASPAHIEAIQHKGLTPLHRVSFCSSFLQESLF